MIEKRSILHLVTMATDLRLAQVCIWDLMRHNQSLLMMHNTLGVLS